MSGFSRETQPSFLHQPRAIRAIPPPLFAGAGLAPRGWLAAGCTHRWRSREDPAASATFSFIISSGGPYVRIGSDMEDVGSALHSRDLAVAMRSWEAHPAFLFHTHTYLFHAARLCASCLFSVVFSGVSLFSLCFLFQPSMPFFVGQTLSRHEWISQFQNSILYKPYICASQGRPRRRRSIK